MASDMVAGLVLAAGRGQRMRADGDPTPKPLRLLAGRALVVHALERLRPQVDSLLLNPPEDATTWRAFGVPCVLDGAHAGCGPLSGLLAGLRSGAHRWVAAVPCDAPCLPADLVARLRAACTARPGARLAIARTADGLQPLCALVDAALADDLDAWLAAGGRRAADWALRHDPAIAAFDDAQAFVNVNTPHDLPALERRLAAASLRGAR